MIALEIAGYLIAALVLVGLIVAIAYHYLANGPTVDKVWRAKVLLRTGEVGEYVLFARDEADAVAAAHWVAGGNFDKVVELRESF